MPAGQLRDNSHFKPTYIKIKPIRKWSWGIDRPVFQEGRFIVSKKSA
jgi:pyridoxamine 5'-phosphate oxidase family protein